MKLVPFEKMFLHVFVLEVKLHSIKAGYFLQGLPYEAVLQGSSFQQTTLNLTSE